MTKDYARELAKAFEGHPNIHTDGLAERLKLAATTLDNLIRAVADGAAPACVVHKSKHEFRIIPLGIEQGGTKKLGG